MTVSSLPDRPLSFNEKETLARQARDAIPLRSPAVPKDKPSISAFAFITEEKIYALHYNDNWECVHTGETPADAFAGPFITNEDHEHPAVEAAFDALRDATNTK